MGEPDSVKGVADLAPPEVPEEPMVTEDDLTNLSVGLGGLPDRDGYVTLDASIMDHNGKCGAVAFLQRIKHPISVARAVMEKTPHVLLAGYGAQKFALANGFTLESKKLTDAADKAYKEWLKKAEYKPVANIENHDTIGMVAMDASGNLSGSCTTSGLAYKIHGRVGDSPIIGAGMYVDNEIGAACATGVGETVLKVCGSFLVVELMRQGLSPMDACKKAIDRLVAKNPNYKESKTKNYRKISAQNLRLLSKKFLPKNPNKRPENLRKSPWNS